MNTALAIDPKRYVRLANRIVVKAIATEAECDHFVAEVGRLMEKGEASLSAEESALLETLAILIEAYDARRDQLAPAAPNEMLAYLLEASGRAPRDLLPAFGTRGRVSEVLSGKRAVSKLQAKKLAALFRVGADLFI